MKRFLHCEQIAPSSFTIITLSNNAGGLIRGNKFCLLFEDFSLPCFTVFIAHFSPQIKSAETPTSMYPHVPYDFLASAITSTD